MNEFQEGLPDTPARTSAERHVEALRQQGGVFVEAVRLTRMPMLVTDPTLPGNPITFANAAFMDLSGYGMDELLGQDPHFMNGPDTDPQAIARYRAANGSKVYPNLVRATGVEPSQREGMLWQSLHGLVLG